MYIATDDRINPIFPYKPLPLRVNPVSDPVNVV